MIPWNNSVVINRFQFEVIDNIRRLSVPEGVIDTMTKVSVFEGVVDKRGNCPTA